MMEIAVATGPCVRVLRFAVSKRPMWGVNSGLGASSSLVMSEA